MSASRAARRCAAALALRASAVAAALLWRPETPGCSSLIAKNRSVTFPLDVDGLLKTFEQDKRRYFRYLREVGIDETIEMSVPQTLPATCLGDAHFVFVGDCFARMSFEAFLRLGGHPMFNKESAELESLEERTSAPPPPHEEPAGAGGERLRSARRMRRTASGSYFLQDDLARATYMFWTAQAPASIEGDLREMVDHVRLVSPGSKTVFWMDALMHGWVFGDIGWTEPGPRREYQTQLHGLIKSIAPDALFIWDSPSYIDMPLMKARPPKVDSPIFDHYNVSQVVASLADQDEQVMSDLGVPMTLRWEVSTRYRGLQCDGMHAAGHAASNWNCQGFPAYEDLVLQSGLQQLCLHRPAAPLCP